MNTVLTRPRISTDDNARLVYSSGARDTEQTNVFDEAMRLDLQLFLTNVANSPLKIRVLQFFLAQPGACVGTAQLAERLGLPHQHLRDAVQELGWQGAITFCPYFGHGDLCLMNAKYQSETMKRDLNIFQLAMRHAPEELEPVHNA